MQNWNNVNRSCCMIIAELHVIWNYHSKKMEAFLRLWKFLSSNFASALRLHQCIWHETQHKKITGTPSELWWGLSKTSIHAAYFLPFSSVITKEITAKFRHGELKFKEWIFYVSRICLKLGEKIMKLGNFARKEAKMYARNALNQYTFLKCV